jgi:hypothetical protein
MTTALLANPFTWIVLGIGLLVTALALLIMNWDAVVAFLTDVWMGFTTWLGESLAGIAEGWNAFWTGIGEFLMTVWNGIVGWFSGALTAFASNWSKFWGTIGQFFLTAWGNISRAIQGAWAAIVSWFGTAFASFGQFFGDFWKGLVDGIGKVFAGIVNFVKAPFNAIIDAINSAIKIINNMKIKVPDWVPGIGGQNWGFNIPTLPKLAMGGTITAGGSVMVGERGAEILTLPKGARVTPLDKAGGKTINYYAAPNESLDSEEALLNAMRRASVVAGW